MNGKTMGLHGVRGCRFRAALLALVAALGLLLAGSGVASAAVCRVTAGGSAGNDGSSWALATTLEAALATSSCSEIWVAEGVYTPGTDPADSFTIASGMAVYGGFAGNETSRSARDAAAHLTILSGDIDDNDTKTNGITETSTDIQSSNAHHVVILNGNASAIGADTVLDGFTITGGDDSGDSDGGGGLWCQASGSASAHCSPALSHLAMLGNKAQYGGAMKLDGFNGASSSPILRNVIAWGDSASTGAEISNVSATPSIDHSVVQGGCPAGTVPAPT